MLEAIKPTTSEAIEAPASILGANNLTLEKEQKASFHNEKALSPEKKEFEPKQSENTDTKLENIAQAMDNYVQSIQRDLKIQVHQNTGKLIVKVISEKDGKVIREIPPEELLDLAAKVEEMMGVLFNESA